MRKEKKYNYIYKTTCLVTNKFYIGLHSTNNINDGYMGSGKRLWYSFKKYGKEKHTVQILEYFDTREELKIREQEIVNKELLGEVMCMNLALGGTGGILNEEHFKNFTQAGIRNFYNNRDKMLINLNKVRKTETYINNLKNSLKEYYENNPSTFKGKTHSEESKKKISESSKGKGSGKSNSQYGSMWITNEVENKKINKNNPIPIGWRKGRILKNKK